MFDKLMKIIGMILPMYNLLLRLNQMQKRNTKDDNRIETDAKERIK
jgi:hypothetical protein